MANIYTSKKPKIKKIKKPKPKKPVYCKYCRHFKRYSLYDENQKHFKSLECKQEVIEKKDYMNKVVVQLGNIKPEEKNKDCNCLAYMRKWHLFWR
jgi:hypothetical protein